MHENITALLIELGAVILALGILGRIAGRLGFSPIPLYLLAGLAFALLTIKPQLGILVPLLLLFERNWRAIGWSAVFTVLLVLAECDPLHDEGVAYACHLQAAGVAVELKVYAGMTHDFMRMGAIVDEAEEAQLFIAGRLAQAFARG